MSEGTLLRRVVELLGAAGIPHMLTGSFASTYHGPPRATRDIDLVIDPSREGLERLLASLDPGEYYVSPEAARDALARRGMFNVVDLETGWKVDLIVRKSRAFSLEEFSRRKRARLGEVEVPVTTAEDTILSKLEWAKLGSSDLQLRDAVRVMEANRGGLDLGYLRRWARELELREIFARACSSAGIAAEDES